MNISFTGKAYRGALHALLLVFALAGYGEANSALGQMVQGQSYDLDFTKPDSVKARVDYSDHDKLTLNDKGLGLNATNDHFLAHAWWQTTEPIALGHAWTPTAGVTIHARLNVDFADVGAYSLGELYARYSPDAAHWSAWQRVMGAARSDKGALSHRYDGQIVVPYREREPYFNLLRQFNQAAPELAGDEEAAARWIVRKDPRYFEKTLPYVGYIQFLFETPLRGGEHLQSLHCDLIWSLPGLHIASKRERDHKEEPPPWSYRADVPARRAPASGKQTKSP